ncbi:MAG: hypothetical protein M3552_07665 [Planctomycetota bacterium]|nr:hypothetical protein [Planctomycetaceae bacterium]MDQ3330515.1 hypothetical protein [Planctomycetota bacterium]
MRSYRSTGGQSRQNRRLDGFSDELWATVALKDRRAAVGFFTAGRPVRAMNWFERLTNTVGSYWDYYVWFAGDQWAHMTPVKYTSLLISIGLIGFLMMGRGNKRI